MEKKKIAKIAMQTYNMQQQVKLLNEEISKNKKIIQEYFDQNLGKVNEIKVGELKVRMVESAYITYNGYKLEKNLKKKNKKDLISKVMKKTYSIINIQAFINLIKLTGITKHELSSHLKIDRKVDSNAVKRLFEKGDITQEDLEGCVDSKIVKSIRFYE